MADFYVATTGSDTTGTGAPANPYATVGKAIAVMAGGDRVYVQTGAYTPAAALTPPAGTSAAAPSQVVGYHTTPGDLDGVSDFTNFPVLTAGAAGLNLFDLSNANVVLANLVLDCANLSGSRVVRANAAGVTLRNLKGRRFGEYGFILRSAAAAERCWLTEGGGGNGAFWSDSAGVLLSDCIASGNTCPGVHAAAGEITCVRTVAANNTGATTDGLLVDAGGALALLNCVSISNGRDGVRAAGLGGPITVRNSIFGGNGGYNLNATTTLAGSGRSIDYNAFYSSTSGDRFGVDTGPHDVSLSGDPFTNAAGGDYSLNNTAGAGAACRAGGFPGVLPGGTTAGDLDIGAVQHQDAGGGGGSTITDYVASF